MRTTLNIDDDVLAAVKEPAQREHRTVGRVLSDLARKALTATPKPVEDGSTEEFYGFVPLPRRGKAVSNSPHQSTARARNRLKRELVAL